MGNPNLAIGPCGSGPAPKGCPGASMCGVDQSRWQEQPIKGAPALSLPQGWYPEEGGASRESTQEHQGWFLTAPVRSQLPTSPLLLLPSSLPLAGSETSLSRNDPGRKRALPSPQFWQAHSRTQLEREISL